MEQTFQQQSIPTIWWATNGSHMQLQPSSIQELQNLKWVHAFYFQWEMIQLKVFLILWSKQLLFQRMQEVLVLQFIAYELPNHTLEELMGNQMVWYQWSRCITTLPDMSIRVGEKEKVLLLFTLNHGMQMYMTFLTWKRTLEKKSKEPEIFSMRFGFQTSSWKEFRKKETGH